MSEAISNPTESLSIPRVRLSPARRESLQLRNLEENIQLLERATICALNQMLDLKDLNTGVHSTRLAEWALRVGERAGIAGEDLKDLEIAAILHDIGKVGVPDAILKKNGPLTAEERKAIEKHSEYGWTILRDIPGFERASLLVLHHHERVDGKGYPAGLKSGEIPFGSSIVCVVDAFDAMVSDRVYRKGLPLEEALRRLRKDCGTQFDPQVVNSFIGIAAQDLPEIASIADPTVMATGQDSR